MKILVLSQYFPPDITAAAFRISETVDDLRTLGHTVRVVTAYPHKGDFGDAEAVEEEEDVYRVKVPGTENRGFIGYMYLYLSFMIKSIFRGYRTGKALQPDLLWASSPPIFVGLAGWATARLLGTGFALDVRDIWPGSAVAAGQLSDTGLAWSLGKSLEKFLYNRAKIITCVAEPMGNYIRQYTATPVHVIYNGVQEAGAGGDADAGDNLQSYATVGESRKLVYAGNFGHVQQLELLVEGFAEWNGDDRKRWEVFLIGDGVKKEGLMQAVADHDLQDLIHFIDPVPKRKIFGYLRQADALFIHLMNSEVLRLTIPSKVFDFMLVNRPILAGIEGEGKKILDSRYGNVLFEPGNREELVLGLEKLARNYSDYSEGNRNADAVLNNFSRRSQSISLHNIFRASFGNK